VLVLPLNQHHLALAEFASCRLDVCEPRASTSCTFGDAPCVCSCQNPERSKRKLTLCKILLEVCIAYAPDATTWAISCDLIQGKGYKTRLRLPKSMSMLDAAPCAINKVQSRSSVYVAGRSAHVRPSQWAIGFGWNKKGVASACGPWDPAQVNAKKCCCVSKSLLIYLVMLRHSIWLLCESRRFLQSTPPQILKKHILNSIQYVSHRLM
jgi:hypothetical protein